MILSFHIWYIDWFHHFTYDIWTDSIISHMIYGLFLSFHIWYMDWFYHFTYDIWTDSIISHMIYGRILSFHIWYMDGFYHFTYDIWTDSIISHMIYCITKVHKLYISHSSWHTVELASTVVVVDVYQCISSTHAWVISCQAVAYLGFQKGGPNFRWPLVLTQREGPNHVFQFFPMV